MEEHLSCIADVTTLRFFGDIEDDMLGWLLGHVLEVADNVGEGRSLSGCELPTPLEQEVPVGTIQ